MEVLMVYNFDKNFAIQTAILDDTLEDTSTNFDELKDIFGIQIAKTVKTLTKNYHQKNSNNT